MLDIPTGGFARSVKKHNVNLDALCDWIEGWATFIAEEVTQSAIVDAMIENYLYEDQDFAKERISDALTELHRRAVCLGSAAPYEVNDHSVRRRCAWESVPAFSFCLMLSLQTRYRTNFAGQFGTDFTEQGQLFERLTAASMEQLGWKTHSTGWSKKSSQSILDKVHALAAHLGEASLPNGVKRWAAPQAKDGGLDVVCHIEFPDNWPGRPLLFIQCASGEDWSNKRGTPDLRLWGKMLDLATQPTRGIAIPFALLADEFRRAASYENLSLFLDRHRVCAPRRNVSANWLDSGLASDLNAWTKSRIEALPRS